MTTNQRDAASDPKPRDRWRKPSGALRRVSHIEEGRVYFTGGIVPVRSLTLAEWRDAVRGWTFLPAGGVA